MTAPPEVTGLRVATFNLLHGVSLADGSVEETRLREAAAALDADVVGLQEVDRGQERSGGVDQTAAVASALGAAYARFAPAIVGTPGVPGWRPATDRDAETPGPAYGIGLVSRLPVRQWRVLRFPAAPVWMPLLVAGQPRPRLLRVADEPRVALAAVVDGPVGPITVVTAHLSFVPGFNARQVRSIVRWVADLPAPRLLAGDLNLPGGLPRRLSGWQQLARVPTFPVYRPRVQWDHVLGDGVGRSAVGRVRALPLPVSDHCALVVEVSLTAAGQPVPARPVRDRPGRPLNDREAAVLRLLLADGRPGAGLALASLPRLRVRERCGCGCDTVDLEDPAAPAGRRRQVPLAEGVDDGTGRVVMLLVDEDSGTPTCLEVYDPSGEPVALPDAAAIRVLPAEG